MAAKTTENPFTETANILGAGIDALFAEPDAQYSLIPLDMIEVKIQIRVEFEDEENPLSDLANSIKVHGVLQPIVIRQSNTGYILVAGERRYRASVLAGLDSIPAIIRDMTDEEAEDAQLAENIHRKNLTQIEEALKIQRDLDRLGSVEAVLEKHQKSRPWLSKMFSLLNLPEQAKRLVNENISADVEIITAVKTIEKHDPEKAKALVDDLKMTRGKENARDKVAAVKEEVKPSKKTKEPKEEKKPTVRKEQREQDTEPEGQSDEVDVFADAKVTSESLETVLADA
jgi:ParB family transcriptional regulator, chromosome partitioning protein